MSKKAKKVTIPDSALKNFSEDEREGLKEQLTEIFSGDMEDILAQSQPVVPLTGDECSGCGSELVGGPTFHDGNEVVQIYSCTKCDCVFSKAAPN